MIRKASPLVNHEIVTLAVYIARGEFDFVDTEDVAKQANEIAPGRFTWRKYKDQINIENVRAFLSDATKQKNGALLHGSGKTGWMLTPAGLAFARQNMSDLASDELARSRLTKEEERDAQWRTREVARLRVTEAFEKISTGTPGAVSLLEAEGFFRIDRYVQGSDRKRRIERVLNLCASENDAALHAAAMLLAAMVEGLQS